MYAQNELLCLKYNFFPFFSSEYYAPTDRVILQIRNIWHKTHLPVRRFPVPSHFIQDLSALLTRYEGKGLKA